MNQNEPGPVRPCTSWYEFKNAINTGCCSNRDYHILLEKPDDKHIICPFIYDKQRSILCRYYCPKEVIDVETCKKIIDMLDFLKTRPGTRALHEQYLSGYHDALHGVYISIHNLIQDSIK